MDCSTKNRKAIAYVLIDNNLLKMNKIHLFLSLSIVLFLAACGDGLTEKVVESYDNGQPTVVRYYNNDNQCIREVHYYDNGALYMEGEMAGDVRNGKWTSYFPDGKVQSSGYFKDDRRTGQSLVYYENGNLWMDGCYRDGSRIGPWYYYDEQGYPTDTINYGE